MKKIRLYGDRALRTAARVVTALDDRAHRTITEMRETLEKARGVGLAATQIGVSRRICLVRDPLREKTFVLVNPRLIEPEGEEIDMEGCLSFPEVYFAIERRRRVVVTAVNERGKEFSLEATGLVARCIQHEIDHLDGILIVDHAAPVEKKHWRERLREIQRDARRR